MLQLEKVNVLENNNTLFVKKASLQNGQWEC